MAVTKAVIYADYLKLKELLSCQELESEKHNITAHDEMLFIIVHQTYVLWFKQILHELKSVIKMFDSNFIDEQNIGIAVARLQRIIEIQKIMINQIDVIETLTPLDFLDFRHVLIGASGFQSSQFRLIENMLGLKPEHRLQYSKRPYYADFSQHDKEQVLEAEVATNLFSVIDKWLARTPFLDFSDFNFIDQYRQVFKTKAEFEQKELFASSLLSEEEKKTRVNMIQSTENYVLSMLDKNHYQESREQGHVRLSYDAFIAAVFINLYRDQPILHQPFRLLSSVLEVDEYLNVWRHRHVLMVHRMIGSKMGTGGSSGHEYLQATANKHRVFLDLYNLSTFLIPRSALPELPEELKLRLGFHYTAKTG